MGDDAVKDTKDILVLGTCDKGLRVAVQEGGELTKLAVLTPMQEGESAPMGKKLVRLVKDDEQGLPHAKMETIFEGSYEAASMGHEGPARVSTERYRNNFDQINWGKPPAGVN